MSKYRKTLYFPGGGRKELYGKTKEELEAKIFEAKMQLRAGVKLDENPQFGKYAIMWYEAYKKPNIQQATREYYKNEGHGFCKRAFGETKRNDVGEAVGEPGAENEGNQGCDLIDESVFESLETEPA